MNAGDILGGRYRLVALIGKGGMGSVWHAHHLELDAPVAIKLMHCDERHDPDAVARFHREAKSAANLRSPHVVAILDVGMDDASRTPYMVMELLRGRDLSERIRAAGPLSPDDTLHIVKQVCRALSRAHGAGIVHRDLKPDNIYLVDEDGEELAKVLDFGIAKWTGRDSGHRGRTTTGSVVGTPHYMSPEQMRSSKHVDYRTDLWSMGVITCECLTGRVPFDADNIPALALKISRGEAVPPSELGRVPAGFDAWFAKACAVDPEQRFQTASELACALEDCLRGALDAHAARPRSSAPLVGPTASHSADSDPGGAVAGAVRRTWTRRSLTRARGALLLAPLIALGVGLAMRSRAPVERELEGTSSARSSGLGASLPHAQQPETASHPLRSAEARRGAVAQAPLAAPAEPVAAPDAGALRGVAPRESPGSSAPERRPALEPPSGGPQRPAGAPLRAPPRAATPPATPPPSRKTVKPPRVPASTATERQRAREPEDPWDLY